MLQLTLPPESKSLLRSIHQDLLAFPGADGVYVGIDPDGREIELPGGAAVFRKALCWSLLQNGEDLWEEPKLDWVGGDQTEDSIREDLERYFKGGRHLVDGDIQVERSYWILKLLGEVRAGVYHQVIRLSKKWSVVRIVEGAPDRQYHSAVVEDCSEDSQYEELEKFFQGRRHLVDGDHSEDFIREDMGKFFEGCRPRIDPEVLIERALQVLELIRQVGAGNYFYAVLLSEGCSVKLDLDCTPRTRTP